MMRLSYNGSDADRVVEWLQANDRKAERMGIALREHAEKKLFERGPH
jgi:hypothetical protein